MSQIRLFVTAERAHAENLAASFDALYEDEGIPAALFEEGEDGDVWCVSIYVPAKDEEFWRGRIAGLPGGIADGLAIETEHLGDVDWVTATLQELAPVRAGRFFVHGSHDQALVRPWHVAVEVDAGLAFGTGHHGTTAGCLDVLERILRKHTPRRALDIGTGSGVLAIALAKAAKNPVLATDIDPVATRVARKNVRKNGEQAFVKTATSPGFGSTCFAEAGPFDLVLANILARPLEKLAYPMRGHLARNATIVLSGLLPHQQARIVSAYRRQGLRLEHAHRRDGWLTVVMRL